MYLAFLQQGYSPGNKLQKAVKDLFYIHNRTYLKDAAAAGEFMQYMQEQVAELNKNHPRCKAVDIEWWQPGHEDDDEKLDWILSTGGQQIVNFTLYRCNAIWGK